MKEIRFQGKKFLIEEEKSTDKTHFVIDFDTLEGWAEAGRVDLIVNNTLNFYKEMIERPQKLQDKQFLDELQTYLKTMNQKAKPKKAWAVHGKFLDAIIAALEQLKRKVGEGKITNQELVTELGIQFDALRPELKAFVENAQAVEHNVKSELLKFFQEKTLKGLTKRLKGVFSKIPAKDKNHLKFLKSAYTSIQGLSSFLLQKVPTAGPATTNILHPNALKLVLLIGVAFNLILVASSLVLADSLFHGRVASQPQMAATLVSVVATELSIFLTYHYLSNEASILSDSNQAGLTGL